MVTCRQGIQYVAVPATLGYAAYTVVMCPCPKLLECKNHLAQYVGAIFLALALVFVARMCA
jgi:hypothetical protein